MNEIATTATTATATTTNTGENNPNEASNDIINNNNNNNNNICKVNLYKIMRDFLLFFLAYLTLFNPAKVEFIVARWPIIVPKIGKSGIFLKASGRRKKISGLKQKSGIFLAYF